MERTVPMDRLVCGDVGYGKTEIAVRAAFKAVQDGKQVAVLVPTTLLVQQHLSTFTERMAGFPVTVKALSRFQTDKEAREVIEGLADGSVDIVIGTHRLLNPDIRVKDLGLIVVDEEQRLRRRAQGADEAAAHHGRRAVHVGDPDPAHPGDGDHRHPRDVDDHHPAGGAAPGADLRRRLRGPADRRRDPPRAAARGPGLLHPQPGQVDREGRRAKIRELVPEARVAMAHGQMGEHQLEQVMLDFWEKRFDVLVCTTIVESGLDVSNANTMIIERADTLGLSQLHQLRGRVGRSRERAYAYFLYPAGEAAHRDRARAAGDLAQHSDLGGGMAIAMKDLEIRGAGNLLGGEQSGHIADVGFDLYVRLVGEAVHEFKGEAPTPRLGEVRIELPVDAHLPHDYIPSERLRLEMYKRLAEVRSDEDVDVLREEMVDRYGEPPSEVESLLLVARFRARARQAGIGEVTIAGRNVRFAPVEPAGSRVRRPPDRGDRPPDRRGWPCLNGRAR